MKLSPEEQEAILLAALTHVPFDGWSMKAIRQGCTDTGFDADLANWIFGGTPLGAIDAFFLLTDQRMLEAVKQIDLESLPVRARVSMCVKKRLEFLAPHKETVRETMSFLAHPTHARDGLSFFSRSMSEIWYAAGDTSTDFNYYTKRMLLGGVYAATMRYWLSDTSLHYEKTLEFLDARLADVSQIPKLKNQVKDFFSKIAKSVPFPFNDKNG